MTPNQFVTDAIRTESRVEKIHANVTILNDTLDAITALNEILDQVKKNAFYGKAFSDHKLIDAVTVANICVGRLNDYSSLSTTLENNKDELPVDPRVFHAIVGISTESAELLEALDLDSVGYDRVNILEELGDLCWYQAIAVDALDAKLEEDVLNRVIAKLRFRYPEKFTSEHAINRDLVKERQVLETNPHNP